MTERGVEVVFNWAESGTDAWWEIQDFDHQVPRIIRWRRLPADPDFPQFEDIEVWSA